MEVDRAALAAVAAALTESGAVVGGLAATLAGTGFTAEAAGSGYATAGRGLAEGLVRVSDWIATWRQAIDASAAGTGVSTVEYAAAEDTFVRSLQQVSE